MLQPQKWGRTGAVWTGENNLVTSWPVGADQTCSPSVRISEAKLAKPSRLGPESWVTVSGNRPQSLQGLRQDAEISDTLRYPLFKAFWLIQSSRMQHLFSRLSLPRYFSSASGSTASRRGLQGKKGQRAFG